jgi:hypothetical protein
MPWYTKLRLGLSKAVIDRCILLGIVNKDSPMPLGREIVEAAVKYHFMKDKKSADGVGKGAGISHTFNAVGRAALYHQLVVQRDHRPIIKSPPQVSRCYMQLQKQVR